MKPVDMSPIIRKYRGYFVALSRDRKRVWGKGRTPEEAIAEAEKKGAKEPVIAKIPEDCRSYLFRHRRFGSFLQAPDKNACFRC